MGKPSVGIESYVISMQYLLAFACWKKEEREEPIRCLIMHGTVVKARVLVMYCQYVYSTIPKYDSKIMDSCTHPTDYYSSSSLRFVFESNRFSFCGPNRYTRNCKFMYVCIPFLYGAILGDTGSGLRVILLWHDWVCTVDPPRTRMGWEFLLRLRKTVTWKEAWIVACFVCWVSLHLYCSLLLEICHGRWNRLFQSSGLLALGNHRVFFSSFWVLPLILCVIL